MSDSEEGPAARRTRAKPDLTVYVSTGSAARSGLGIPTPSSLIGRLDVLTRKMAGSGVSQENVFEEYDGVLPTPAEKPRPQSESGQRRRGDGPGRWW